MSDYVKTGTVEGTGAAITISVGFVPSIVKLFNIDGNCFLFWNENVGAGKGQKVVDSGSGTTDISTISSNGVTVVNTERSQMGFIIGADTDINVSGETIVWEAYM